MKCKNCESTEDVAACARCGSSICPSHRWGTGELSDGYYCTGGTCGVSLVSSTVTVRSDSKRSLKRDLLFILFVAIATIVALIYILEFSP